MLNLTLPGIIQTADERSRCLLFTYRGHAQLSSFRHVLRHCQEIGLIRRSLPLDDLIETARQIIKVLGRLAAIIRIISLLYTHISNSEALAMVAYGEIVSLTRHLALAWRIN
ncbi:hypothetical protein D1872_269640 [compost metagenome]